MSWGTRRDEFMRELEEVRAKIRAARRQPKIKRLRMHPLDIAKIEKLDTAPFTSMIEHPYARLIGYPLEPDCAVPRGKPAIDYEEKEIP